MTFERIAEGLRELVLRLANNQDVRPAPAGWQAFEWTYVQGIASHGILALLRTLGIPEWPDGAARRQA
jgi:hypothetical protein